MRLRETLSPEQLRELDALERALAGEPVDPDLSELAELVGDVRATAPQMTPGFAARLEHDVAEGFPQAAGQPPRRRPRRWMLLPAAGSLAAALVALLIVLDMNKTGETQTFSSRPADEATSQSARPSESAPQLAEPDAAPSAGSGGSSAGAAQDRAGSSARQKAAPAPPLSTPPAPPVGRAGGERKVQRSADLVLRVPNARVESASDGVIRTVDRFGGIVASSSSASQGSHAEATFDLRIPTDRLDDALGALSKLGHVVERHQDLVDITGSFTSLQDRLSDARAERRGLLKALGRASTQQQIDSLRARLRTVRSQIARLNGDLEALRRRADLSTVRVTVRGSAKSTAGGTDDGGSWSPGDAARDAVRVLEVIAGVALIALAVLAPLALLGALVALGVRAGRRRRREGALDAA